MVIREELLKPVIFEQRHEGVRDEVEEPREYPEKIDHDTLKKETKGTLCVMFPLMHNLSVFMHRNFSVLGCLLLPVRQYPIKSALNIRENLLCCITESLSMVGSKVG